MTPAQIAARDTALRASLPALRVELKTALDTTDGGRIKDARQALRNAQDDLEALYDTQHGPDERALRGIQ